MKIVAQNRRARFDYEIVETLEAGMILTGQEVKACRAGQINLSGSYVSLLSGRPFLKNAKITRYAFAGDGSEYHPGRDRELLLHKNEIEKMQAKEAERGWTMIPLEVHVGKYIKILIGIAKGRKKLDKRQHIKDRDTERRLRRGKD